MKEIKAFWGKERDSLTDFLIASFTGNSLGESID